MVEEEDSATPADILAEFLHSPIVKDTGPLVYWNSILESSKDLVRTAFAQNGN